MVKKEKKEKTLDFYESEIYNRIGYVENILK